MLLTQAPVQINVQHTDGCLLQVVVKVHGRAPLHIELPFGVDARQGKALYMNSEQMLSLELPYKSYASFTQVRY